MHAFIARESEGYVVKHTWEVMGMRDTCSGDTILDSVFVPDQYIARVVPPGASGMDSFLISVLAWALMGFGNVYYGLAQRAFDVGIEAAKKKSSIAFSRSMAYHPEVQHTIAEMAIELESIGAHLEATTQDWSNGVDHGPHWPAKIFAAKYRASEGAWKVVDRGLEVMGGYGIFRSAGYERLSAMRALAAFTRRIRSSLMRSSQRPR